jgi:two-component system chemotaxis response regulator CheY
MRILIVDDDFAIRKIISIWLRKLGDCELAENGLEAVDMVKKAYEEGNPYKLMCLDIMMPVMNGIDALKNIRKMESDDFNLPDGEGIKVIMATAASNPKSIMGAFNEQCEAYLIKPVDEQELFSTIKKLGLDIP